MKSVFSSFFLVVLFVVQSCGSDSDPIIEVPSAGSFSIYNKSESSYVKNQAICSVEIIALISASSCVISDNSVSTPWL